MFDREVGFGLHPIGHARQGGLLLGFQALLVALVLLAHPGRIDEAIAIPPDRPQHGPDFILALIGGDRRRQVSPAERVHHMADCDDGGHDAAHQPDAQQCGANKRAHDPGYRQRDRVPGRCFLLGCMPSEIAGQPILDLFHQVDPRRGGLEPVRARHAGCRAADTGIDGDIAHPFRLPDGRAGHGLAHEIALGRRRVGIERVEIDKLLRDRGQEGAMLERGELSAREARRGRRAFQPRTLFHRKVAVIGEQAGRQHRVHGRFHGFTRNREQTSDQTGIEPIGIRTGDALG